MTTPAADPTYERFALVDQIEEAERELHDRYGRYAYRVREGKMQRGQADKQIALMRNIRDTLRIIAKHYDAVHRAIADDQRRAKNAAELDELRKHPVVAAVASAFDGEVGLPRPAREPEPYHYEPPPFGHDYEDEAAV